MTPRMPVLSLLAHRSLRMKHLGLDTFLCYHLQFFCVHSYCYLLHSSVCFRCFLSAWMCVCQSSARLTASSLPGLNIKCQEAVSAALFTFRLGKQSLCLASITIKSILFYFILVASKGNLLRVHGLDLLFSVAHWPHRLDALFLQWNQHHKSERLYFPHS